MNNSTKTIMNVDDYDIVSFIGKGRFAKVLKVVKKDTCEIYAMKILRKRTVNEYQQEKHIKTERKIFALEHPYIVKLHYAFQTEHKLYMVLDFVGGGDLFHHLKKNRVFTEYQTKIYVAEILLALEYLHSQGIIYRDLKAENILLDNRGYIRLTDFGLSTMEEKPTTFCGSPEYISPEVLKNEVQTQALDFWSLGILTYELVAGLPPFYDENQSVMYDNIVGKELEFTSFMTKELKDILTALLMKSPTERLDNAKDAMNYNWFSDIDFEALMNKTIDKDYQPEKDILHIDSEYANEKAEDSLVEGSVIDEHYKDFDQF